MRRISLLLSFLLVLALQIVSAQDLRARIDTFVTASHRVGRFNGAVLVARDGKVILEKGYGQAVREPNRPATTATRFYIGSVTKQFTAALILQLVEQGKVDLQAPIGRYLPDYPEPAASKVTVHHLLTHTSGIPSYTDDPSFVTTASRGQTLSALIASFSGKPAAFEPGTNWAYSNSGFVLLGAIVERVTGKPLAEVMQQRLFKPAGMQTAMLQGASNRQPLPNAARGYMRMGGIVSDAPEWDMSNAYGAGAILATARDMYQWDVALRSGRILKPATLKLMEKGQVRVPGRTQYYGYGIFTDTLVEGGARHRLVTHGGGLPGFLTAFHRYPEEGIVVVVLDNTSTSPEPVAQGIVQLLRGQTPPVPRIGLAAVIAQTLESGGIQAASERFRTLFREKPADIDINENELNMLGYGLLQAGRIQDAVGIFRLNVEAYPESANTYDSMGEALLAAGDSTGAIENYRKSLALNPLNENARGVLVQLKVLEATPDAVLTDAQMDALAGKYELTAVAILRIWRDGKQMKAQLTGQPEVEIFPRNENEFYLKVVEAQISFVRDESGRVKSLVLHQGGQHMPAKRID